MAFFNSLFSALVNYFNFSGRANRRQFWFWAGFAALMWLAMLYLDLTIITEYLGFMPMEDGAPRPLSQLWLAFVVVPTASLLVRRVHDHDEPGWKALFVLPLSYYLVAKGTNGPNRFG